ncbi:glycosyltransferase [Candidatus Parcubacteria bacterium]|nr:glycosyltransferase [Candidatus Parcubacteria bacterium]
MPKISIIIPTYQEEQYIEHTLKQFQDLKIPHEIIVTDGGSVDKTLEIVKKYTDKVVVWDRVQKGRRQTFGEAKNLGASLADGKYYVFIDADVSIFEPQKFFEELIAYFEKTKDLVALTVPMRVTPEFAKSMDSFFGEPINFVYKVQNNWFGQGNASGEFQMITADAFKKVNGYGEHLAAGEDNDMFRRLRKIGLTRYYAKLPIYHTFRRPHKVGWLKLYGIWIKNGIHVSLYNKSPYKEWDVVR